MTNFPDDSGVHAKPTTSDDHDHFLAFLAEHGVTDTRGLEIMRRVHRAAHAYDIAMNERMRDTQMSAPRWRLLLRLHREEQCGTESVNPTELSKAQKVSKNTISAHLRSLEEQGLIVRELNPNDRRQFRIRLSDAGRALVLESTPGHIEYMNTLIAGLDDNEIDQLYGLLEKLARSVTNA